MDNEKYNNALEKARIRYDQIKETNSTEKNFLIELFPELIESKDENIRKAIICGMNAIKDTNKNFKTFASIPIDDCIAWLENQKQPIDKGEISDGYHTFNELYRYRMLYNAAFFNLLPKSIVHKSKRHHDGDECFGGGWFIVMANLPTGQISNHYELEYWDLFQIPERETADKWDGHTPQEAADRLYKYLTETIENQKEYSNIKDNFNYPRILYIRPNNYYYCIQDCFINGNKQASRGDIIVALPNSPIMTLDIVTAAEYFLPVNNRTIINSLKHINYDLTKENK